MLDALDISEEEALGLAEVARHDLAMVRSFAARAQAAEDPDVANDLARSYQRAARSYRQTLALKVRLKREIAAAAREAREPPVRDEAAVARRVREVRSAVRRLIYNEYEPSDAETRDELLEELEVTLVHGQLRSDFTARDLDDHVVAVCHELDLPLARARQWRDLPDPDARPGSPEPDPEPGPGPEPGWQGSG